jgi:hypothetical protein
MEAKMASQSIAALAALTAAHVLSNSAYAQYSARPSGSELSRYNEYLKPLPRGFHHFIRVPDSLRPTSSNGIVLCGQMENAISYGKRIAQGMMPVEAVDEMFRLRGERNCGYVDNLVLMPVEYAVRGDDANNRILIVKVIDRRDGVYYIGEPLVGGSGE